MDKRRLSAIMFTDIVGYTLKMGEDEIKMLRLLKDHSQLVETAAENHDGEIVKRMGDGYLISFGSALNAVLCAIDIQQALRKYNKDKPETDQVHIRIGIHLGDIVISEGDVFGNGVNVASRIEPLAHPDGICITRAVYDIVKKKMTVRAVELGPQQLKNVDETVEVFHLLSETVGIKELRKAKKFKHRRRNKILPYMVLGAIALIIAIFLMRQNFLNPGGIDEILRLVKNTEVPENRVAVLPLRNLTGDNRQDYLTEGLAEELIFRLSRIRDLYVYPLSDVLAIMDTDKSMKSIRKALGVKYLIQGNLQQQGDSLIVVLEVFDTETQNRLSSDRYIEASNELKHLHGHLAKGVLFPIVGRVSGEAEASLAAFASTSSFASDLYLQARHAQRKAVTWDDQKQVLKLYESAISSDSSFALARAHLAEAYAAIYGKWQKDTTWVNKAKQQAVIAVSLTPDLPEAHYALGRTFERRLQYDLAEASYRQAIILRPEYQAPLNALGNLYMLICKNQEALSLFRRSIELSRALGDRRGEARCLNNIGLIHENCGDCDQALELYMESLAIKREIGDSQGEGISLNNIGNIHINRGEYDQALESYNASLLIRREIRDRRGEAACLNNIGSIQYRRGEYDQALESYNASLLIRREICDRRGEATCLNNIGSIQYSRGDYDHALESYTASLSIKREIRDRRGEGISLTNIGSIYGSRGEYEKALKSYTASLAIKREIGDRRGETVCLLGIGNIHYNRSEYEKALEYYEASLTIKCEIGDRKGEAYCLNIIGLIHKNKGDYDQAMEYYESSLAIRREIGDRKGESVCMHGIGNIHDSRGEYEKALEYYETSLVIDREIGDRKGEASCLNNIGEIHHNIAEYKIALEKFEEALSIYNDLDIQSVQIYVLINITKLHYYQGQIQTAHDTLVSVLNHPEFKPDEYPLCLIYFAACEAKLSKTEVSLKAAYTALDSINSTGEFSTKVEAHRVLGRLLLDLDRTKEAREQLTEGQAMADTTGMKGEVKKYDELIDKLKEI
ncbi:MAG: tetratricopeptide repeat protein [Calditrichaeota bacterium]|nr:tetratricopeptide repeat protein [Calditrichota bacterium]